MPYPLLIKDMLERGVKFFPKKEIVCRELPRAEVGLPIDFRYTYRDFDSRVRQAANMLQGLGVKKGDVVTTFATNSHRHFELHLAVPCKGAIFEPLIIMLPKEVNINVINRAGSRMLVIDESSIPLFEGIKDELKTVETYIIMTDKKELPKTKLPNVYSYEELMAKASTDYTFPEDLDENSPALLANTTGTTGPPKMFMHSHRSIFTHAMDICHPDIAALSRDDVVLVAVPVWYFNHWNITYAAVMTGAKIVIPHSLPSGQEVGELVQQEKVTLAYGLSSFLTGWIGDWEKAGWKYDFSSWDRCVAAATARAPVSAIRDFVERTGIHIIAGNGFSEACPAASLIHIKSSEWAEIEKIIRTDGIPTPLTKWKVVNPKGEEVAHDGKERGMFGVKGPHVIEEYYKDPEATAKNFDKEGYFYSGDMATIDEDGFLLLRERIEDLIRAEGGFISPGELEDVLGVLPAVRELAVVGVPRGEFEKPLACVVLRDEYKGKISEQELLKEFEGKIPESWMPEIAIIEEMPRGATGKYDRRQLKKQFGG
jgi:fatty-acyl-CoA synthase